MKYETDVVLGERYRDAQTGVEGVCTAVSFFQYGCERAELEVVVLGAGGGAEIKNYGFDVPRLVRVDTGEQAVSRRPGGPDKGVSHRRPGTVAR